MDITEVATSKMAPDWTSQQIEVIQAPVEARLLVEAGPGTGKTAVACARVAHLVEHGINASSIFMLSFTRTAVAEIRNRIHEWSSNPEVSSARITTVDSLAWFFRHGAGEDLGQLGGSYDDNVQFCIQLLAERNQTLDEYLEGTTHIIIDEAQDLTGLRSQFLAAFLKRLRMECGVTVFCDPVQSIYGFTTDSDDHQTDSRTFLESYPFTEEGFQKRTLDVIHRSDNQGILRLFTQVREQATADSVPAEMPIRVLDTIANQTEELTGKVSEWPLEDGDLILSRRRVQALSLASWYDELCRLRLPNLPAAVNPWIGLVFHAYTQPTVSRDGFNDLWDEHDIDNVLYGSISSDHAWGLLQRHARGRRGAVDLLKLRRVLSRSRPHIDFCLPDFGMWGPIFGTIHASKGREADRVILAIPRDRQKQLLAMQDPEGPHKQAEEARVYYVGATRARRHFRRTEAQSLIGATALTSGRAWHSYVHSGKKKGSSAPKARIQIGLDGDFDSAAILRRDLCASEEDAIRSHQQLIDIYCEHINGWNRPAPLKLTLCQTTLSGKDQWRFRLDLDDTTVDTERPVGWMNPSFGSDLWKVGEKLSDRLKAGKLKPANTIKHLKMNGLMTVALDPDSGDADLLHEPFARSGFCLAPMFFGFPTVYFNKHFKRGIR